MRAVKVTIVALLLVFLLAPVWAGSQGEKSGPQKVSGKIQFLVADGPPMKDYLEALTKDFMKENPGVEVEMIWSDDGIVIRGKSPKPVYLWIRDGKAERLEDRKNLNIRVGHIDDRHNPEYQA